jgi:hypothetical protein
MPASASIQIPPLHHIGYVVDELATAVPRFAAAFGAGPFFAMEHIPFDAVSYRGGPATYDHSSAFGAWGPMIVELSQVHAAEPAGLREQLVAPGAGVGHVAWLADSLELETERLQSLGMVPFHAGRTGPASAVWFDGGPLLGHPIEVLQLRDELLGFYDLVRRAAKDWDGSEPLRLAPLPPPPA